MMEKIKPLRKSQFSLVISMQHEENAFLFAGDAENPRLGELISEGIGRHDVLKVPHHGRHEKLSASFLSGIFSATKALSSALYASTDVLSFTCCRDRHPVP